MKRLSIMATVVGVVIGFGLLTLDAGSAKPRARCSLATLKGRYLFAHSGTLVPPAFGVTVPTPGADAGFHIFNGDGTGKDIVTVRIGGTLMLRKAVVPITYTIKPDCTGSYTPQVSNGPSFDLFVAPTGERFAVIATAPQGNYVSDIDHRVSACRRKAC
jgi:hypothetical protein